MSSLIVFGVVPQCPLVHVRLRLWVEATDRAGVGISRATTLQILPSASIRPIVTKQPEKAVPGDGMTDAVEQGKFEKLKKSSWWWPSEAAGTAR